MITTTHVQTCSSAEQLEVHTWLPRVICSKLDISDTCVCELFVATKLAISGFQPLNCQQTKFQQDYPNELRTEHCVPSFTSWVSVWRHSIYLVEVNASCRILPCLREENCVLYRIICSNIFINDRSVRHRRANTAQQQFRLCYSTDRACWRGVRCSRRHRFIAR